jgi:hypothetical protein
MFVLPPPASIAREVNAEREAEAAVPERVDLTTPDPGAAPDMALRAQVLRAPPAEDPNRWTTADTVRELATLGLIGADWHQTRHFREDGIEEMNPVLGPTPSRARVNFLIGAAMLGHPIVARLLPRKARTLFQLGTLGGETWAVRHNWSNGYVPFKK